MNSSDLVLAAEDDLAAAHKEQRDPDRRHEEDDVGLADKRAQHHTFHPHGKDEHHEDRTGEGQPGRHPHLGETDERQRREDDHDPLREVEDARRTEDQDEAQRDERVEDAGDEPFPQDLQQEIRGREHVAERRDEDVVKHQDSRSVSCAVNRAAPRVSSMKM